MKLIRRGTSSTRASILLAVLLFMASSSYATSQQLQEAVKDNDISKIRQLVKAQPNLVFSKDESGFTPLHLAAANGYKSMVELLLTTKADVNAKDNARSTPLHQAAAANGEHSDIVKLLITHKAEVNAVDTQGLTPLHYALLADNPGVVRMLLDHGANPNLKDTTAGQTPLILAAAKGYKQAVELLLLRGADVNAADDRGTPLVWAIHTGHANVADLLRQHGGHE